MILLISMLPMILQVSINRCDNNLICLKCDIVFSSIDHLSIFSYQFSSVSCFGRLMEPVSRASAYRKGYSTPFEPDDAYSFNCVGDREDSYLWRKDINGKCGICGDPWMDQPHKLEAPGMFAKGIIFQKYKKGQNITISVDLVENYGGFFMFRLCPNDDFEKDPEQECFNRY